MAASQSSPLLLQGQFTSKSRARSNSKDEKMFEFQHCATCKIFKKKCQPKKAHSKTSFSSEKESVISLLWNSQNFTGNTPFWPYKRLVSNALDLYFILGQGKEDISEETKIFDDIVVGDFIDSYRNLTLKTLTAHTFLNSTYFDACKASQKWVIFHDDDSYVDYRQVFDQKVASNGLILKNSILKTSQSKFERTIQRPINKNYPGLFCMWNDIKPQIPLRYSKYGVTMDEYPFGYWYPGFCNG